MSFVTASKMENSEPESPWTDQRWALVQRVVRSPAFVRSEQLSKLLLYVCQMAISNRCDEISEQRVGVEVFGRSPEYDPAVDGIVRSHATRLRRRLELYFQGEGANEALTIEMPRGGYVLHFVPRELKAGAEEPSLTVASGELSATAQPPAELQPHSRLWHQIEWKSFLAGVLITATVVAVVTYLTRNMGLAPTPQGPSQSKIEKQFWGTLFPANARTLLVPGDSGLVLFSGFTGQDITLADYLAGSYWDPQRARPVKAQVDRNLAANLASRRYTSIVDLRLTTQLTHLPQWNPDRAETIFARDLSASAAQDANLILIGSREANPWVSLVEPSMNFVLESTGDGSFQFVNRNPRNGEQKTYSPILKAGSVSASVIYGVVAYLPNPSGKGMVLVLNGLWMSGTQAAGDFVLNSKQFSAWLRSIVRPDGTIPPFELLIQSKNLQGSAVDSTILSERVMGR